MSMGGGAAQLTVRGMVADPALGIVLRVAAGEGGLDRLVLHPRVQKSGLALAGHYYGVVPTRVQVLGQTELSYLDALGAQRRVAAATGFFGLGLSCVVVTRGSTPQSDLLEAAEATSTPLLVSDARTSRTINSIHALLDERLAPRSTLHGVLVDVFGVGLLLLGKSGIGKSECALELVMRGHRLVADDVVECDWRPPGMIFGTAPELLRNHLEIRGLGVLNIHDLFGVTSITPRKRIDVVVQLTEWDEGDEYDRLGLDEHTHEILGSAVRKLVIPVRPGRDMGTILEIAARNELLRREGKLSARTFLDKLEAQLVGRSTPSIEVPESIAPGPPRSSGALGRSGAYAMHESSSHLPAVRPKGEEP
jgi:HPr kinase/phosphorylase